MIRTAGRLLALAVALCAPLLAVAQEKATAPTITPYGFLLFDAFFDSGPFNNKDNANQVKVPAVADSGGSFVGSARTSAGAGVHRDLTATLLIADADLSLTRYLQVKREYYTNKGAEDGYSGGFPSVFPANPATTVAPPASFVAVTSDGWWAQATVKPIPELWLAGGYGSAQAGKSKLSATAANTRYANNQLHGAIIVNASRNLRIGLELAQTQSKYVVEGAFKATQASLGTQLSF